MMHPSKLRTNAYILPFFLEDFNKKSSNIHIFIAEFTKRIKFINGFSPTCYC